MNEQMLFGIEAIQIPRGEEKERLKKKRRWENVDDNDFCSRGERKDNE